MRTTAIMNLKGGTGKTVTAINLAAILARDYAQRVLLVDADSQASLTEFVTTSLPDGVTLGGLADLLRGLDAFPMPSTLRNVRILHADASLMALDVSKAGTGEADPLALADFLEEHWSEYDVCIIDCPPAFNAAAMAALIAADDVVIPVKLDAFGIRGLANLLEQVRNMRRVNSGLTVAGVLPTMYYDSQQSKKTLLELRKAMVEEDLHVFHWIQRSDPVDKMTFEQQPLISTHPRSNACRDYRQFAREYMGDALEGGEQDGI